MNLDETTTPPGDSDAQAIIDVALRSAAPTLLEAGSIYAFATPVGGDIEIHDLEKMLPAPRRKRGIYHPATVEALTDYLNVHSATSTTVWVHPTSGSIVAIVDDHGADTPGWREHRVELQLTPTPEWTFWLRRDGHMLSQVEFAEHIEEGAVSIVRPDAATMLEVAQTFHAHTTAEFRSSTRLQSGETRLAYDETVQASAGAAGDMIVPTELQLSISPFLGEPPYRVTARLRFRVNGGKLTLGYRLDRPDRIASDALDGIRARIVEHVPRVYLGTPPTAA